MCTTRPLQDTNKSIVSKSIRRNWNTQHRGDAPQAASSFSLSFQCESQEMSVHSSYTHFNSPLLPQVQDDHSNFTSGEWSLPQSRTHRSVLPSSPACFALPPRLLPPTSCTRCCLWILQGITEEIACFKTTTNYYHLQTSSLWRKLAFPALSLKQREVGSLHWTWLNYVTLIKIHTFRLLKTQPK